METLRGMLGPQKPHSKIWVCQDERTTEYADLMVKQPVEDGIQTKQSRWEIKWKDCWTTRCKWTGLRKWFKTSWHHRPSLYASRMVRERGFRARRWLYKGPILTNWSPKRRRSHLGLVAKQLHPKSLWPSSSLNANTYFSQEIAWIYTPKFVANKPISTTICM